MGVYLKDTAVSISVPLSAPSSVLSSLNRLGTSSGPRVRLTKFESLLFYSYAGVAAGGPEARCRTSPCLSFLDCEISFITDLVSQECHENKVTPSCQVLITQHLAQSTCLINVNHFKVLQTCVEWNNTGLDVKSSSMEI